MGTKVWMVGPDGGSPQEVEATADKIVPLMVKGWTQCEAPARAPKKMEGVIDGESA